jgi:hypothetical protein
MSDERKDWGLVLTAPERRAQGICKVTFSLSNHPRIRANLSFIEQPTFGQDGGDEDIGHGLPSSTSWRGPTT